jgi:hypothetical protein
VRIIGRAFFATACRGFLPVLLSRDFVLLSFNKGFCHG